MERKQASIFAGLFVVVVAFLALIWFMFLRPDFAILYQDIREADAGEIVAELDREGIEYRLEDGGHRISVPENEVGRARVLIAGSGIAMGGVVGFELFNESDMGLTEFAQKVNYQRALQGELARTIMAMDGIEFARVHLSLPERVLFRASQQEPKAAVTVQTQRGRDLALDRVAGIQQLVASAVIDMTVQHVAVLNDRGRLLSSAAFPEDEERRALNEKEALEEYYRARVRGVAERLLPGLAFQIRVLAISAASVDAPSTPGLTEEETAADQRNFQLRIIFRTEAALNTEDQAFLRDAIIETTGISDERGDVLRFETGAVNGINGPSAILPAANETRPETAYSPPNASPLQSYNPFPSILLKRWFWMAAGVFVVLLLILVRRRSKLSSEEQQSFADMLGESMAMRDGASNAR